MGDFMQEYTSHAPGTFCWVDLATTNTDEAKKFYSEIFGWQTEDIPMGENVFYTYLHLNGKPVAALAPLQEEQKKLNIPPHWMSYVSVEDAEQTLNTVKENGGNVLFGPMDVFEFGKYGLLQDPDGGSLGIWQPMKHFGSSFKFVPGSLCWTEFGSHDRDKARLFFENVFGWNSQAQVMGGMEYTVFNRGEEMIAGLYALPQELQHLPSHWLPYFEVANINEAVDKTAKLGGEVMMPGTYAQGIGSFAVLRDPQGAVFGVIQSDPKTV